MKNCQHLTIEKFSRLQMAKVYLNKVAPHPTRKPLIFKCREIIANTLNDVSFSACYSMGIMVFHTGHDF